MYKSIFKLKKKKLIESTQYYKMAGGEIHLSLVALKLAPAQSQGLILSYLGTCFVTL